MDQQPAALRAHGGQHGAIHAHHAKDIHVEKPLELLDCVGLGYADGADAGVIDHDIDAPRPRQHLAHALVDGGILRNIHLHNVQRPLLIRRSPPEGFAVHRVTPGRVAHGGKDRVTAARQSLGGVASKTGAGSGDQNDLIRVHLMYNPHMRELLFLCLVSVELKPVVRS